MKFFAALLLLAGCSSTKVIEVEPLEGDLTIFRHLTIQVRSMTPDRGESLRALSRQLLTTLKKERIFPHVSRAEGRLQGDLQLLVDFSEMPEDSGRAYVANADIVRTRDHRRLARIEIPVRQDRKSNTDPIVRARSEVANQLVKYLRAKR